VGFNFRVKLIIACVCVLGGAVQAQSSAESAIAAPSATPRSLSKPAESPFVAQSLSATQESTTGQLILDGGTYAVFHSSEGDFLAMLFAQQAPQTVKAFVELAQGKRKWTHPVTGAQSDRPLFNNTLIYRTIQDSTIYGGDPINKGTGDAGFQLPLETVPALGFDQPGMLAMDVGASAASSGSRWFITLRPFPDRTGQFTIFGKVAGGLGIVRKIANRPTKRPQLPLDPVVISSVEIMEIPAGKQALAQYQSEMGRDVLSVDANFTEVPAPTSADVDIESRSPAAGSNGSTTAEPTTSTVATPIAIERFTTAGRSAK